MGLNLIKFILVTCLSFILFTSTIKTEPLQIHIIPHSHDDVGWLDTLDGYYYNYKCVKCILDSMLISLEADPKRKFTYVEMAFFSKWYNPLSDTDKLRVKNLIKNGQLEFANGGWVMNDEADANYQDIIDQMRIGMNFLKTEFNYTPKTAWSLDPFGHSKTHARIMQKLGFETLVFMRIDYKEKEQRIAKKELEFEWSPYYDIDQGKSKIFTHIGYDHYNVDYKVFKGFMEEDDLGMGSGRVKNLARKAFDNWTKISKAFRHNHVFVFYGDDFTFQRPHNEYKNIESLMSFVNNSDEYKDKMQMFYSTPDTYFKAVKLANNNWPEWKNLDFFPYADKAKVYWTGYFTTRPFLKGIVRDSSNYLINASNLLLYSILKDTQSTDFDNNLKNINVMRENLAIAQHHDAVSGTATEKVSNDYIDRLKKSIKIVKETVNSLINSNIAQEVCLVASTEKECLNLYHTVDGRSVFQIVNPGYSGVYPMELKVNIKNIKLMHNDEQLKTDIFCEEDNKCIAYFLIKFSKKILIETIEVKIIENSKSQTSSNTDKIKFTNKVVTLLDNSHVKIDFNFETGFEYFYKKTNKTYKFKIRHSAYLYQKSTEIRNYNDNLGGSYIMSPETYHPSNFDEIIDNSYYYIGKNIIIVRIKFNHSQMSLKIYKEEKLMNLIEAISVTDQVKSGSVGEEFLLNIESSINNLVKVDTEDQEQPQFFTDTNSLVMIKRIKDYRFGWSYKKDEKISSNFYPVNMCMTIQDVADPKTMISVFNDRTQAGGAMKKGQILLDINRATDTYDYRGLNEAPCEEESCKIPFEVKHWIAISSDFSISKMDGMITKKPLVISFKKNDEKKLEDKNLINLIESLFEINNPKLCRIDSNVFIKSRKSFLIQFLNKTDPFWENTNQLCTIRIINSQNIKVSETDLSGLTKYNSPFNIFSAPNFLRNKQFNKGKSELNYQLHSQEFKTFLIDII